jgi:hypothetical protein
MKYTTVADVINVLSKYPLETTCLFLANNSVADRVSCQEAWIDDQLDNICLIGWNSNFVGQEDTIISEIK